ncbi:hypothetical protein Ga0123462_2034 [Mariprofundus ferrinatatus]|uniref:Uncharacterized protein n=1 Tax=Mariprofundus ferrinatatus TaxID=1921087 RepID=A0A2K8LAE4_9PROT|nr:hypothetical protein [Mariprofundus ferrinatatus]ATX82871.1 hypothetical protein Ga0123462_2034 [Mariprofundus ferrinatatus]
MDEWFNIVVRQLILYTLPLLVSLTMVVLAEARLSGIKSPHPFFAISWKGSWIPLLVAIFLHRGVIVALPRPLAKGIRPAVVRLLAHGALCLVGFILYTWSLSHQPPTGLPPLHHWWAKVLMFFNLCMVVLHLLPLPLLLMGELAEKLPWLRGLPKGESLPWIVLALLVATPLIDISLGSMLIYPIYESLSSMAVQLSRG